MLPSLIWRMVLSSTDFGGHQGLLARTLRSSSMDGHTLMGEDVSGKPGLNLIAVTGTRAQTRGNAHPSLSVAPMESEPAIGQLGRVVNCSTDEKAKGNATLGPNDGPGFRKERGTVTSKKLGHAVAGRGRSARVSPELAREMCTCGHKAGSHAALKYSCQAPGDHKGFCPCMRFLSAKEWRASKAKPS